MVFFFLLKGFLECTVVHTYWLSVVNMEAFGKTYPSAIWQLYSRFISCFCMPSSYGNMSSTEFYCPPTCVIYRVDLHRFATKESVYSIYLLIFVTPAIRCRLPVAGSLWYTADPLNNSRHFRTCSKNDVALQLVKTWKNWNSFGPFLKI